MRATNIHHIVNARETAHRSTRVKIPRRHFVKDFVSSEFDQYKVLSEQNMQIPPFACAYNNIANEGKYLAIADEEGTLGVIDTNQDNRAETAECPRYSWRAHQNAIFDVQWSSDDRVMVTASGDQSCKLWDVEEQKLICTLAGHECSVKSVQFKPDDPS
ncbi:hypothetical protein HDU97_008750 [Phlyctochytrium planicorne]|nr:hypothetical protein HDU97_008750 [Phlyctochytrium planicorne]